MNLSGPAEFIEQIEGSLGRRRERQVSRNLARRMILKFRVPESYVDLVSDPQKTNRPSLVNVVSGWVLGEAEALGVSPSEVTLAELESRFYSHLSSVFDC